MNKSGRADREDRDRDRDHHSGRERRNTLRCYQEAALDTPERLEEDKVIELVHTNTREEVDELVMARLQMESKLISTEGFFQVLSQVEEVQDMEGIIYNSGLITKFMDDKFTYEALTLRGCHVVIGMFIQQARKHSERLKKESNKTVATAKPKYIATLPYLKLFFTCKLHDGRHDYRWKGIPSMSSKAALMVIVLLVTVVSCVALIAVLATINTFTIESSQAVARRLSTTVAGMDSFVESTIREMQYEYASTSSDLAKISATSLSQFDEVIDTVRRTTAMAGESTFSYLLGDAIKDGTAPAEEMLFGMAMLKYDVGFGGDDLLEYLATFDQAWNNGSATANTRTNSTYPIDFIVYNMKTDTVLNGNYTSSEAANLQCVQQAFSSSAFSLKTMLQGVETNRYGNIAATLSTIFDADTAICAMVETRYLYSYLFQVIGDKMLIPSYNNYTTSLILMNLTTGIAASIYPDGSLRQDVPSDVQIILNQLQPGTNTTFVHGNQYIVGAYMFQSAYFPDYFVFCINQTINIDSVGAVSSLLEDGSITTLLAGVNPDQSSFNRFLAYGEPAARGAAGLTAISLALSGRSGAIFTSGNMGRDCLTMYFPIQVTELSSNNYAMLVERDLTGLTSDLRKSFLASSISERDSHHEIIQYFLKKGRMYDANGAAVDEPSHHAFLLDCFYSSDLKCQTIDGDQICCALIEDENTVLQLRLKTGYMNRMIALAGYTMIAVVAIALIAIGSIRLLTRLVLDHIEKDYEGYREQIEKEKTQFSELVKDVMPPYISKKIMAGEKLIVDQHPQLTFLFSDIVSFTEKSRKLSTTQMVRMLGYMFMVEDGCAEYYGIHKIKTIGDAYFCVSGLEDAGRKAAPVKDNDATTIDSSHHDYDGAPREHGVGKPEENQVYRMVAFATTVQLLLSKDYTHYPERTDCFADLAGNDATGPLKMMSMRMGIHSGPAIAGVVDVGRAPQFDCLGPSVNLASRMESTAMVDRIQLSSPTYDFLRSVDVSNVFEFEEPKKTLVKGYGTIKTYHIRSSTLAVPEILIKTLLIDRATRRRFFSENGILQETGNDGSTYSQSHSSASRASATEDTGRDDYEVQPIQGLNSGPDTSPGFVQDSMISPPSRDNLFGDLPPVPEPP